MKIDSNKIKQWEADSIKVATYYSEKIKKYGLAPKALGNREEIEDKKFFEALFENLKFDKNISVLDIGSGTSNLIFYLENKKININDYLGIDLIPEFIEYTKNRYPNYEFENSNFISENFQPDKKFDLVVAMGVLVSRVNNYNDFIEYFIEKALKFTKKFFVFNIILNIDESSLNYEHKKEIGGITFIKEKDLVNILNKLNINNKFRYNINRKMIYKDATDAFVQIEIN